MIWILVGLVVIQIGIIVWLSLVIQERNMFNSFLQHQLTELNEGEPAERLREYVEFLHQMRESNARFQATHEPYIHEIK